MKTYNGLGKENMDFDEAMDTVKSSIHELDDYVLNLLFDLVMNESEVRHELN